MQVLGSLGSSPQRADQRGFQKQRDLPKRLGEGSSSVVYPSRVLLIDSSAQKREPRGSRLREGR